MLTSIYHTKHQVIFKMTMMMDITGMTIISVRENESSEYVF